MATNCVATERALREIYLLPFMIAIKISQPGAVMTAYNRVNGPHASENEHILKEILREEWGWDDLVMSDWEVEISQLKPKELWLLTNHMKVRNIQYN